MIGVDTNVLLRLFVDDDPAQARVARDLVAEAPTGAFS
jgi:predicted nucleic-acid-binding protein